MFYLEKNINFPKILILNISRVPVLQLFTSFSQNLSNIIRKNNNINSIFEYINSVIQFIQKIFKFDNYWNKTIVICSLPNL